MDENNQSPLEPANARSGGAMSFGPIMQHGYVVADVEKSAELWAERMGVGPFYVIEQRVKDYRYRGKPMDLELRIAVSYWGPLQIELIQPLSGEDSFYHRALKVAPDRLNHVAVLVSDIDATVKTLNAEKYVVQTGGSHALKFAYLENYLPDGSTFELMQMEDFALPSLAGMAAVCRAWDGTRLLRPMADFMADLTALRTQPANLD